MPPEKAVDWHRQMYAKMEEAKKKLPYFDIWVMPVENHPANIHARLELYTPGENHITKLLFADA